MNAAQEKLKLLTAAEVCAGCELETDVTEWLKAEPDAAAFLQQLTDAGHHMDAVQFLCHALEPREAVWLAWDSGRQLVDEHAPAKLKDAVSTTLKWLTTLEDKDRRAAHDASEICGIEQSAGSAALAAFFADGSLGPVELAQSIPVPAGACAKAAACAIFFAAVEDPPQADQRAAASVASWFELGVTEPPWGDPPISSVGSVRVPEPESKDDKLKAEAPGAVPPGDAPKPTAPKGPAPKADSSGYDDGGYDTDMKF
jgi:hypothetical protein